MTTAIVIHSCDKYHFVLDEFFKYFGFYMDHFKRLSLPVYLTTEELDYEYDGVTLIKTGTDEWSTRLAVALRQIEARNIILIQEDFFFTGIHPNAIDFAIKFHNTFDADITKLGSFYEFSLTQTPVFLGCKEEFPIYEQKGGDYIMSHQPVGIFNKTFLMDTLQIPYDPWHHEIRVSEEIKDGKYGEVKVFTIGKIYSPTNKSDIMTSHHAIRKGQYIAP